MMTLINFRIIVLKYTEIYFNKNIYAKIKTVSYYELFFYTAHYF